MIVPASRSVRGKHPPGSLARRASEVGSAQGECVGQRLVRLNPEEPLRIRQEIPEYGQFGGNRRPFKSLAGGGPLIGRCPGHRPLDHLLEARPGPTGTPWAPTRFARPAPLPAQPGESRAQACRRGRDGFHPRRTWPGGTAAPDRQSRLQRSERCPRPSPGRLGARRPGRSDESRSGHAGPARQTATPPSAHPPSSGPTPRLMSGKDPPGTGTVATEPSGRKRVKRRSSPSNASIVSPRGQAAEMDKNSPGPSPAPPRRYSEVPRLA